MWEEQDSNLRRLKSADLQSAPVGHFGIFPIYLSLSGIDFNLSPFSGGTSETFASKGVKILPRCSWKSVFSTNISRADGGSRTHDLLITNQLL